MNFTSQYWVINF